MIPPPYQHQAQELEERRDIRSWALFWDCGTGKTRAVLDLAVDLWRREQINGLFVVAPSGVHQNWVYDEIPKFVPDDVPYRALSYSTKSSSTKWQLEAFDRVLQHRWLSIFTMSYDAIMTQKRRRKVKKPADKYVLKGREAAKKFLTTRRCLYVLDEAHLIKTPDAGRTKRILASARYAPWRRTLTGTPIANKPFDIFTQMRFIDPEFWKPYGLSSYGSFKTYFGIWRTGYDPRTDREYPDFVAYRNLPRLKEILTTKASRITKEQALPDLPPKSYTKFHHEISSEQVRVYESLLHDYRALVSSGSEVTVRHKLVLLLRLQQVVCGYVPTDDGEEHGGMFEFSQNPRFDLVRGLLDEEDEQEVVYARFQRDVTKLCDALGKRSVRYDGLTGEDDRRRALEGFWAGDYQFLVGNPACAGTGLNLQCARKILYYSNSCNLVHRQQSEDRIHRSGQNRRCIIGDVVATGTVDDAKIIPCLREKREIALDLVGDDPREWI